MFILNFYTNIIITNLLYKERYQFYYLDKTIYYKQLLLDNIIVIDIKIIYNLLITKYKLTSSYSLLLLDTRVYILYILNSLLYLRPKSLKDPLFTQIDILKLQYLYSRYLRKDILEQLVDNVKGVEIYRIPTIEYKAYTILKVIQVISQRESNYKLK